MLYYTLNSYQEVESVKAAGLQGACVSSQPETLEPHENLSVRVELHGEWGWLVGGASGR